MSEEICYKRNFLTSVIARIDFLSPFEEIQNQLPKGISDAVSKHFPIPEPVKAVTQQLQFSPTGAAKSTKKDLTEWRFHGKDRTKTLTITHEHVFVEYTAYNSYDKLRQEFFHAARAVFGAKKDTQASRVGLRYINEVNLDTPDPLRWEGYINEKMLALFSFPKQPDHLSRVFNTLEFNFGEDNLRYQFGLYNPDYPQVIRRKSYVLDLDAYCQRVLSIEDIEGSFDVFHDRVQEMFESSITDRLREVLNDER